MRICIVSPHLDDAILSCGVLMQRHAAAGGKVFALNIFTAGTNGENRRKEEQAAQSVIGAEPYFFDELDAPDRDPKYIPLTNLFFGALNDAQRPYIEHVAGRVRNFLSGHKIDLAIFPLGAGGHIDHRTAFEVGRRITSVPVRFYEDRPYILWPGVLQGRMNQIGADAALPVVTPADMQATLHSYHYLKHFVPEGYYQDECLPMYYAALKRTAPVSVKSTVTEQAPARETELKKLYEALARYDSQMHLIYSSFDNFVKDSLAHEQARTGTPAYIERSWTLQQAYSNTP